MIDKFTHKKKKKKMIDDKLVCGSLSLITK